MTPSLFILNSETVVESLPVGFTSDGMGWFDGGDNGYAVPVDHVKVRTASVDGCSRTRKFKSLAKAAAFVKAEGLVDGVSDDGVVVLRGVTVASKGSRIEYSVRGRVVALALA